MRIRSPSDKTFSTFYGTRKFICLFARAPSIGPCPKPDKFSPHPRRVPFNIQFNIIIPFTLRPSKWPLSLRLCDTTFVFSVRLTTCPVLLRGTSLCDCFTSVPGKPPAHVCTTRRLRLQYLRSVSCCINLSRSSCTCSRHEGMRELDGGEWSASHPGRFIPGERVPSTH